MTVGPEDGPGTDEGMDPGLLSTSSIKLSQNNFESQTSPLRCKSSSGSAHWRAETQDQPEAVSSLYANSLYNGQPILAAATQPVGTLMEADSVRTDPGLLSNRVRPGVTGTESRPGPTVTGVRGSVDSDSELDAPSLWHGDRRRASDWLVAAEAERARGRRKQSAQQQQQKQRSA